MINRQNAQKTPSNETGFSHRVPLAEPLSAVRPKMFILDTCYLISLARSDYPIAESLQRLKEKGNAELIVTKHVLDELISIARSGRLNEDGRLVISKDSLARVHGAVNSGLLQLESFQISDGERGVAVERLRRNSGKNNSRLGEGELSIWSFVRAVSDMYDCTVLSMDSDVKALFAEPF